MSAPNPYQLLVEGAEDKRVIPELIEKHGILWEPNPKQYYVEIKDCGGIENIIKDSFISSRFKTSNLKSLGIIIDADGLSDDQPSRVSAVLGQCKMIIPEFDWTLSENGIVTSDHTGKKIGLWVMPDNVSPGMLESLLLRLSPEDKPELVEYARSATQNAKSDFGAPYAKAHEHKAIIHTFLAWQDPPGRQLHQAIQENVLSCRSPIAESFVEWFRTLFPPNH